MRFGELRRILQHVVVAGLPLTLAGCDVADVVDVDCTVTDDRTFSLAPPFEPSLRLRIESCRVDRDACDQLCRDVLAQHVPGGNVIDCKVSFAGDDVSVAIAYEMARLGPNCPVDGRRPAGLVSPSALHAHSAAGAWLAQAAWLEAASVHAFVQLARELGQLGAPRGLIGGALAAARDEVRHAAIVARLAHRYGAIVPAVQLAPVADRALEAIAIENAAEGCVRETWGAVVALWQARVARDPELRAAFAEIARDEIRHAALAWAIDRWAAPQLAPEARSRVAAARERAARELMEGEHAALPGALGLPGPEHARGLLARTYDSLWSVQGGASCRG
ncbi:MAG: hypothetical protein ACTHU0_01665 [Kofleriaceae bacterium]